MSEFSELLVKLQDIQNNYFKKFQDDIQRYHVALDKFEENMKCGKNDARDTQNKSKVTTALQIINEDEEKSNSPNTNKTAVRKLTKQSSVADPKLETVKKDEPEIALPKTNKRSRNNAGDSPEPESRRPKRNAGIVAQSFIAKQKPKELWEILNEHDQSVLRSANKLVNVNLNQKLRREDSSISVEGKKRTRGRRGKDKDDESDKENSEPLTIQIKEEKISIPPEPMDMESESLAIPFDIKQEPSQDDVAMPPPAVPLPKPRGRGRKAAPEEVVPEPTGKRSSARNRKEKTEEMPPPPMPAPRATRASSRASSRANTAASANATDEQETQETRPKRTRGRKKADDGKIGLEKQSSIESDASPDKPRPKRTRRGKAAEKQKSEEENAVPTADSDANQNDNEITFKKEKVSQTDSVSSPILTMKSNRTTSKDAEKTTKTEEQSKTKTKTKENKKKQNRITDEENEVQNQNAASETVNLNSDLDKTVVLLNGVYNHAPVTPEIVQEKKAAMNETVILDRNSRETVLLDNPTHPLDATVVLDKAPPHVEVTDDESLLTDDASDTAGAVSTPPTKVSPPQPTSAVKVKVQQFEELAARTTRTKTRAMAKKEDQPDNHTPPDKMIKPGLSTETLTKMNNLIFNGKVPHISASASKPCVNIVSNVKSFIPASASKVTLLAAQKKAAEEKEKEDARKKKMALLEQKREAQRRKREEKTAAAAAARLASERERQAAIDAINRAGQEKQTQLMQKEREKQRELEKKKQESARKVAETDSRRRAEEVARQQRIAEEQRKAELAKKMQMQESEAIRKEAAKMAKQMEKKQKEYIEKQKLKQKLEAEKIATPLRSLALTPVHNPAPVDPVYMSDGFQYLNSDSEDEEVDRPKFPVPEWSTSKMRWKSLTKQACISQSTLDSLFSVRVHSVNLCELFPAIDRRALKRTSSAVWRTPPNRLETVRE